MQPSTPWTQLHLDYAQFEDTQILIIVDSYSKWIEAIPTASTTSAARIDILREVFAQFGLPTTIVTDNGPQFQSAEFLSFAMNNGIQLKFTAPYHPNSNGQAERYVRMMKEALKSNPNSWSVLNNVSGSTLLQKLSRFLLAYRRAPHTTTGVSPAELLLVRRLRSRLDLLQTSNLRQREIPSPPSSCPSFHVGNRVNVQFYGK